MFGNESIVLMTFHRDITSQSTHRIKLAFILTEIIQIISKNKAMYMYRVDPIVIYGIYNSLEI